MLELKFPKRIGLEEKSFEYLVNLNRKVEKVKKSEIRMDFSCTTIFVISHLAMMMYIVEGIVKRKNKLVSVFKNFEVEGEDVVRELYKYYGDSHGNVVNPCKLKFLYDNNEEQPWLDKLRHLELEKYDKIKVVISELVANLKMHTLYKEGTMAGHVDVKNQYLILSIANYDITIKNNLKRKQRMIFYNDYEAVLWALKRSNTTRDEEESGGLGLYLLRKYIHELGAECIIISGNCFLKLDRTCFDKKKENIIHVKKYNIMSCSYEGNIITLSFPLIKSNKKDRECIKRQEISLGEMYGMYN